MLKTKTLSPFIAVLICVTLTLLLRLPVKRVLFLALIDTVVNLLCKLSSIVLFKSLYKH